MKKLFTILTVCALCAGAVIWFTACSNSNDRSEYEPFPVVQLAVPANIEITVSGRLLTLTILPTGKISACW